LIFARIQDGSLPSIPESVAPLKAAFGGVRVNKRYGIRAFQHVVLGTVLFFAALPAHATFPGKNGRIAFVLGPDVYTMNPDGSDVKQLTNLGPDNSSAFWESWSPDGKQIAFTEFRPPDYEGQIWVMNADGSNQHVLLAESDFENERPRFTPDSKSLIFSRCPAAVQTCALYEIDVTGGAARPLTNFELGVLDLSPAYSSQGTLVYNAVFRRGIICGLYVPDSRNSELRRLTPTGLSARFPDWSPDGKTLVFSTHCANPQNEEIWVVNVEGNGLRRLTNNGNDYFAGPHDVYPSWSPQGDAIVFERDAPDFSSSAIFIMKRDGSSCTKLFSLPWPARANMSRAGGIHGVGMRTGSRNLLQIEEGGADPQWGVAAN